MNSLWTSQEIAAATQGHCSGVWDATAVGIDTRTLPQGGLFVALPGVKVDGHDFVQQALANGAAGALVSKAVSGVDASRLVMVKNVETALQQLGVLARARSAAKIVGVTGSVGKTGAKEMLAVALGAVGHSYATKGNLNNHLGVPLSLANMPCDAAYAIIEMGMNHAGEISPLSHWARPDVALITTVEAVHIEHLKTIEAIADEKAAIFDGMGGRGIAVLNADNAHFARLKKHAEAKELDRVMSFGAHAKAVCRLVHYSIEDDHSLVEAVIAGTPVAYRLGTVGKHWAVMSVAVLGIVDALGGDLAVSAAALEYFVEPKGRGQIRKLATQGGYLRLIDDSYNASPVSVKGAIEKLAGMRDASATKTRTLVVLGDMLELGEHAEEMHVGLVPTLINNQMDLVFAAGTFMEKMYHALPESMRGAYRATSRELAPAVVGALQAQDLVLVKGSRGSRMDVVVAAMEENADAL
ncbi:MAG: UDP-N-acetylmuramoyl-tripeptide--D-alanyl-D-alanine ligase [Rickettsiales bacterium]